MIFWFFVLDSSFYAKELLNLIFDCRLKAKDFWMELLLSVAIESSISWILEHRLDRWYWWMHVLVLTSFVSSGDSSWYSQILCTNYVLVYRVYLHRGGQIFMGINSHSQIMLRGGLLPCPLAMWQSIGIGRGMLYLFLYLLYIAGLPQICACVCR